MTRQGLGIQTSRSVLIEDSKPIGSVALLTEHLKCTLEYYLKTPNKKCAIKGFRGHSMEMDLFSNWFNTLRSCRSQFEKTKIAGR